MDMDVDPPAFKELGTEQHLTNMSMKREDGETLTMSRELRDTTGTYSLYLDLVALHLIRHLIPSTYSI